VQDKRWSLDRPKLPKWGPKKDKNKNPEKLKSSTFVEKKNNTPKNHRLVGEGSKRKIGGDTRSVRFPTRASTSSL